MNEKKVLLNRRIQVSQRALRTGNVVIDLPFGDRGMIRGRSSGKGTVLFSVWADGGVCRQVVGRSDRLYSGK
jgi:hypothetical protein